MIAYLLKAQLLSLCMHGRALFRRAEAGSSSLLLVLSLLVLSFSAPDVARAATSFDCSKARTDVEHLLCSDDRAGEVDRALAAQYKRALAANRDAAAHDALRADQLRWMRQRDAKCGVAQSAWRSDPKIHAQALTCLRNVYDERYRVLMDWIAPPVALANMHAIDVSAVEEVYPHDAGYGAMWIDAVFSPDGALLALVTPVMRGKLHDQVWLYWTQSGRMLAVTPAIAGVGIGKTGPQFPRTDAYLWGDDGTLYVWTRDAAGKASIMTADRNGAGAPVAQVPDGNDKRSSRPDLSRTFKIPDRAAASRIMGNARYVVWARTIDEHRSTLYLGRADGSRDVLAEGDSRLEKFIFDAERSRVFYPSAQGIVRHDLATDVRQRIVGTTWFDTPEDINVETQQLAWQRQAPCGSGDAPTSGSAFNICLATMVSP